MFLSSGTMEQPKIKKVVSWNRKSKVPKDLAACTYLNRPGSIGLPAHFFVIAD